MVAKTLPKERDIPSDFRETRFLDFPSRPRHRCDRWVGKGRRVQGKKSLRLQWDCSLSEAIGFRNSMCVFWRVTAQLSQRPAQQNSAACNSYILFCIIGTLRRRASLSHCRARTVCRLRGNSHEVSSCVPIGRPRLESYCKLSAHRKTHHAAAAFTQSSVSVVRASFNGNTPFETIMANARDSEKAAIKPRAMMPGSLKKDRRNSRLTFQRRRVPELVYQH